MIAVIDQLRPAAAAWAVFLLAGGIAVADDASPWHGDERSAVRLIAGSRAAAPAAPLRAGFEIRLKPGWHTYWRYPGDAGMPPRFDFSGSRNLKSVEILWPAPQRLLEGGLVAIGYSQDVILPLAIVPHDWGKPVALRLDVDYAICEKLCVPAQGKAALVIATGPSAYDAALTTAEARVPKKVALGEGGELSIRSVHRDDGGAQPRVIVEVAAPPGVAVDLFAEGPTPDWALPVPAAAAGAPAGLRRFAFDLDGAPPGSEYRGALVTLTAVAGDAAIEVTARLD
jgi:DsbC/DsbD-like thiol-disulfide interchange protein